MRFFFNKTILVIFILLLAVGALSFFALRYEAQFGLPPDFCRDGTYAKPFWESPIGCKVYVVSQFVLLPVIMAAFFGGESQLWAAVGMEILGLYILAVILYIPIGLVKRLRRTTSI
ncbi:hypothetical protein HY416_03040 [Candidatus Kaiserbacteria bacterium]|nr:hypothetical protein [Candidatus Kaiserbacteria bacterium]